MYVLRILTKLSRKTEGSSLRMKSTILPTCTISYFPTSSSGRGEEASSRLRFMFCGSHSLGGKCEADMSKPSNCELSGTFFAKSTSHVLCTFNPSSTYKLVHLDRLSTYPVPQATSATFKFSVSKGTSGWIKNPVSDTHIQC